MIPALSDKDYQLVSKTYRRVCEQYYENAGSQDSLDSLVSLTTLIP